MRRTRDGRHKQARPRPLPREQEKLVGTAGHLTRLGAAPGVRAQADAHQQSQNSQATRAVFAIRTWAYPRPKNASQNVGKHGGLAKQRLRDSPARSVRGGRAAQGSPSIRVTLNRGDTHADVQAELVVGTSKGRHDEPAQATSNAHPTTAAFGCGSFREGGSDQSIHRHRRRAHRGSSDRDCRNNQCDGVAWRLRHPRQGLSPEGPRPLGSGRSLKPGPRSGVARPVLPAPVKSEIFLACVPTLPPSNGKALNVQG